jgi:hypothetical protein
MSSPEALVAATQPTDAGSAKRFRDKAAEAEQMIDSATTEARRKTLRHVAQTYLQAAEQLEMARSNTRP